MKWWMFIFIAMGCLAASCFPTTSGSMADGEFQFDGGLNCLRLTDINTTLQSVSSTNTGFQSCIPTTTQLIANSTLNIGSGECLEIVDIRGKILGPESSPITLWANSTSAGISCFANSTTINNTVFVNNTIVQICPITSMFFNPSSVQQNRMTNNCNVTVSAESPHLCNVSLNFNPSNQTQTFINLSNGLAVIVNAVPQSWCYENLNLSANTTTVFYSSVSNNTFACLPPPPTVITQTCQNSTVVINNTAECPQLANGFYNMTGGQTLFDVSGSVYCQNQTIIQTEYMVLNVSTQNLTCSNKLYVAICTDNVSASDLPYLARGDGETWLQARTENLRGQIAVLNQSIYGPGGFVNQSIAQQIQLKYYSDGGDIIHTIILGIAFFVGGGIIIFLLSRNSRSANNMGFRRPLDPDESSSYKKKFDDEISKTEVK